MEAVEDKCCLLPLIRFPCAFSFLTFFLTRRLVCGRVDGDGGCPSMHVYAQQVAIALERRLYKWTLIPPFFSAVGKHAVFIFGLFGHVKYTPSRGGLFKVRRFSVKMRGRQNVSRERGEPRHVYR